MSGHFYTQEIWRHNGRLLLKKVFSTGTKSKNLIVVCDMNANSINLHNLDIQSIDYNKDIETRPIAVARKLEYFRHIVGIKRWSDSANRNHLITHVI